MKLQSASRKEVARMASGCGVCAVLEIAAFVLLHVCGIGSFSYQIITGTIGVIVWQILSGGDFFLGILPVVFGCGVGVVTFFLVNLIEWKRGVAPAPSAFLSDREVENLIALEELEA